MTPPDPSRILETGFSFWSSKVLLTAVEFELFTTLGNRALSGEELGRELGIHPRGISDFFDALVAMGFLYRDGDGPGGLYRNTESTGLFLDKNKPSYIGGILEMCSKRLFRFWSDLGTALKTGKPQNEIVHGRKPFFEELYEDVPKLEQFVHAMTGMSYGNFQAFADTFDFSRYATVCDAGGASGLLSVILARKYPGLRCTTFDLPQVGPIAEKFIESQGLSERIAVISGDFFADPLPQADIVVMGQILHDWGLEKKKLLIRRAYDALPEKGAFVVIESLIDDARRENAFGMLMSLNMLIEFGEGFDYTASDFQTWCREAGFKTFEVMHLAGPCSAVAAYK